jgi:DNA-binding PadR family transcriptional regulator
MAASTSPALSLTDWVVLGLLVEEPRHGFALARELGPGNELGELWTVRRPLVYRAIEHLLETGDAEPRAIEPGDQGPDRRVLGATRAGRARLRRWLDVPVEHPRDVRTTLLVKLALLTRRREPLAPLARRQLATFAEAHRGLRRRRRSTSGVAKLGTEWRYQANDAIRRFLEQIIRDEERTTMPS